MGSEMCIRDRALAEQQEAGAGEIAEKAFKRGYNVSARVHCYLWGNLIGV